MYGDTDRGRKTCQLKASSEQLTKYVTRLPGGKDELLEVAHITTISYIFPTSFILPFFRFIIFIATPNKQLQLLILSVRTGQGAYKHLFLYQNCFRKLYKTESKVCTSNLLFLNGHP
jgi:hypothetical protein